METTDAPPSSVVLVRFGGGRYALPMAAVAEVGRPPVLTRVPGVPAWVAGVANWRGRVLAVLDLGSMLAAETSPAGRHARVLVLTRGGITVGLLTEGVDGTTNLDAADLEPSLVHLPEATRGLLRGQVTDASGPVGVLDLDALFALADELPRPRRAG